MPHAVEVLSETSLLLMDDGGDRPGCTHMSVTNSETDAPCWSRALWIELDTDEWTAHIAREWAQPDADYSYSYGSAEYATMSTADDFNLIGGSVNYLGDVGGGDDRYLVAMVDIVNASYHAWELRAEADDDGAFELVAELSYDNDHAVVTNGNYRLTPVLTLKGESSTPPLRVAEEDRALSSAADAWWQRWLPSR